MFHCPCRFFRDKACGATPTHILIFVTTVSVACHRRDQATSSLDLTHAMVHCIGNVEIVLPVCHHSFRRVEHGSDRWFVVTVIAVPAHPGHSRNNTAAMIDATDTVTPLVDKNDVAFPIHRESDSIIEL